MSHKSRYFGCVLCESDKHGVCKCKSYNKLKQNLSLKNYVLNNSDKLKQTDENGFCAAAIIPYVKVRNRVFILSLIETRANKIGLNFIGGKRECIKHNDVVRMETSYETALNELREELNEIFCVNSVNLIVDEINNFGIPTKCIWMAESKMALYCVKLSCNIINDLIPKSTDTNADVDVDTNKKYTEAEGFVWIQANKFYYDYANPLYYSDNNLDEYIRFHKYSSNVFKFIEKISKKKNINNFFN